MPNRWGMQARESREGKNLRNLQVRKKPPARKF